MEDFSKRLKDLRKSRDLSLDMVVYDINNKYHIEITKSHLSRWENGKNTPSIRYAAYLAAYYNVSLDYLAGNTDIKTPLNLLTHSRKKEK